MNNNENVELSRNWQSTPIF